MVRIRSFKLNNDNSDDLPNANDLGIRIASLNNSDNQKQDTYRNLSDHKRSDNNYDNQSFDGKKDFIKHSESSNKKDNKLLELSEKNPNNNSQTKYITKENDTKMKKNNSKRKRSTKSNKPNKGWIWALYILAALAVIFMIYIFYDFFSSQNPEPTKEVIALSEADVVEGIAENIYFHGVSLKGMDQADFEAAIIPLEQELESIEIVFLSDKDENAKLSLTVDQLGYSYDSEEIYENAVSLSALINEKNNNKKQAGILSYLVNAQENIKLSQNELAGIAQQDGDRINLLPIYQSDEVELEQASEEIYNTLSKEISSDEKVTFNLETLKFEVPAVEIGYSIEKDVIVDAIKELFEQNELDHLNKSVILPFEIIEPKYTAENINDKLGLISSGTTEFVTYDPPRDANVARVAESISGMVLMPGEEFSYWDAINPVTVENGYQEGYQVGAGGQFEKVIGGGICQGSSTLYHAVSKADLEIVQRNNHTVPSVYIYEGLDAMVSDWSDFKFKNNTDYPIAIVGTSVASQYVQFDIYGKKFEPGITIEMEPYFIRTEEPGAPKRVQNNNLAPGTEVVKTPAIVGSHWGTDKVWYQDGVEIKREFFANSHYWAYEAVIEYGPEQSTTTPTTTQPPTTTETPASTTTTQPPTVDELTDEPTP